MLVEDPVFAGQFRHAQILKSKNIKDPATSIQDQPMLALVFAATA